MAIRLCVREVAQKKGIGMLRLSRLCDVSYKTVKGIWGDPYRDISMRTLEKFAKGLGVTPQELIVYEPVIGS